MQHESKYSREGGSNYLCALRYASQHNHAQQHLRLKTTWPSDRSSSLESLASSASQPPALMPALVPMAPMATAAASTVFLAAATSKAA